MTQPPVDQAAELLAEYMQFRDQATRDRLVEHHLPWVMEISESTARRMNLADPENAAGECALLFAFKILPSFSGKGSLVAYTKICITRRLVDMLRQRQRQREVVGLTDSRDGKYWFDSVVAPPPRPPRGIDWTQMSRGLTKAQAKVLRMRFKDYMPVKEAGERLGVSCSGVKRVTRRAIDAARAVWGDDEIPDELLAAENQN